MLTCFRYFFSYLWLYLIRIKEIKIAKGDLTIYFIKNIFAKNVFLGYLYKYKTI